jgi:uncharacterized membrane protein YgdD (TMEM256/DUF423 family)
MNDRNTLVFAALALLTGVAAGAFGAHGLKAWVSPERLAVWQTAVQYQLVHGLALLLLVALGKQLHAGLRAWAARLMVIGILVFSGSLYALVLSGVGVLGAITPLGGTAFIAAWALVALAAIKAQPGQ